MSRFTKKGKQNQCLHVSYQREQKGEATGQNAQLESASPGMHPSWHLTPGLVPKEEVLLAQKLRQQQSRNLGHRKTTKASQSGKVTPLARE